jgi:hypothetical protein
VASAAYPKGLKAFLDKDIDMLVDDIVAILYDSGAGAYDPADQFISDLPGAGIIDRSGPLSGKSTTGGVFDANNETITTVPTATIEAIIIAADLGADSASPLIGYLELAGTYGSSGADVTINWNASGIFSI